ncbi:dnaJ domain containing protein isoform X2 [Zea mays]|uniref:dnaJ domain containing protein isoform X2 n=1 Tax=Zea mays TaxID=4577 RepID=UPI0009A9D0C9|nr:dnaJ domain containing protein isoform X2 [Zea mays]|eukprot:XP_020394572.1 dnaJ domain containing protein isoform X2 [Zea mays]
MIAVASSFPSRAHAAPFGSGTLPPPSTRRSTSLRHPRVSALGGGLEGEPGKILDPRATPFQILGLDAAAGYSAAELKAAFRARVKEFHPDVCKDPENADLIMRRVIEAYQMLSGNQEMMFERNNVDPFDEPECEARDIFVNELLCIGTGCPYSCVKRAPHVFSFSDDTGTARAISQGNGEDDLVQLAVGQCPRKCIYYVTPCQRTILEDVLASSSGFPPFKSEVRE